MKYTHAFIVLAFFGFTSSFMFCEVIDSTLCERPRPSQNFSQFLRAANYSPHCIQYLRKEYPQQISEINAILEQRYIYEYKTAIADLSSRKEKLALLAKMFDHLVREPDWIDNGWEPYLANSDDGSDRGGEGLRVKALEQVIKEIESQQ